HDVSCGPSLSSKRPGRRGISGRPSGLSIPARSSACKIPAAHRGALLIFWIGIAGAAGGGQRTAYFQFLKERRLSVGGGGEAALLARHARADCGLDKRGQIRALPTLRIFFPVRSGAGRAKCRTFGQAVPSLSAFALVSATAEERADMT